ncbi:MAG: hypothetical protein WKF30_13225 [Pyrinomonadaceae bacterium]
MADAPSPPRYATWACAMRETSAALWERIGKPPLPMRSRGGARAALEQKDLKFSADWVVRSNEITTFHNLRDEALPLAAIIDSASADPIPVRSYIQTPAGELNVDRINIMKDLLRNTLRQQIHHRGIVWQHTEKLFIFTGLEADVWTHLIKGV